MNRTWSISPRLELFFALAAVLEDRPADLVQDVGLGRWVDQARRRLDQSFRRRLGAAQSPAFWRSLAGADLPRAAALAPDVDSVIEAVAALPPARLSADRDAEALQFVVVDALRRFDRLAFAALWRPWREDLAAGRRDVEARLPALPLEAAAARARSVLLLPSRFAPPGFVATAEGDTMLLPLDPDRLPSPKAAPTSRPPAVTAAARDPALIFRALGDATRYTIAGLIAREPMSSAELARRLGIAKPTMAHHLRALRAAGLVMEEVRGTRIVLALDRAALERLSETAVAQFFGAGTGTEIRRSRRA